MASLASCGHLRTAREQGRSPDLQYSLVELGDLIIKVTRWQHDEMQGLTPQAIYREVGDPLAVADLEKEINSERLAAALQSGEARIL